MRDFYRKYEATVVATKCIVGATRRWPLLVSAKREVSFRSESTPPLGRYFVPRCENGKKRRKGRKGKERGGGRGGGEEKRNQVTRVKTSRLPFRRAEKKEFATSCRRRFPVSLRPRRGRQSNLGVESERQRTCDGGSRPREPVGSGSPRSEKVRYREGTTTLCV